MLKCKLPKDMLKAPNYIQKPKGQIRKIVLDDSYTEILNFYP